jgi:shikimate kinase
VGEFVGGPPHRRPGQAPSHVVFLGPMGSGKTTVGRLLAKSLSRVFVDSDEQLTRRFGLSGREIDARSGLDALHAAEVEALIEAIGADEPSVIAAAAAVADSSEAMAALLRPDVAIVILDSPIEVLTHRLRKGDHRRSVSVEEFQSLTSRRKMVLAALGPVTVVDTSNATPEEAVEQIMDSMSDGR